MTDNLDPSKYFVVSIREYDEMKAEIERARKEVDLKGYRLDDALDEIERLRAEVARLNTFLHPIGMVINRAVRGE